VAERNVKREKREGGVQIENVRGEMFSFGKRLRKMFLKENVLGVHIFIFYVFFLLCAPPIQLSMFQILIFFGFLCNINMLLSGYILKHTAICSPTKSSPHTQLTSHLKSLATHFQSKVNIMS